VGYPAEMAAALSGVTMAQLRDWRRDRGCGPVLGPARPDGPAPYGFGDVLALRAFVRLGRRVPLRRIGEAFRALEDPGGPVQLRGLCLVREGGAVLRDGAPGARHGGVRGRCGGTDPGAPGTGAPRAGVPGRGRAGRVLLAPLSQVLGEFTPRAGVVVPSLLRPRHHVVLAPGTQGGQPVIAGTRVPFDAVADLVADGVPPERVGDHYPGVTAAAARDAVSFARYVTSYRGRRTGWAD
jgi:uncharacterized protein (DUF433 family)